IADPADSFRRARDDLRDVRGRRGEVLHIGDELPDLRLPGVDPAGVVPGLLPAALVLLDPDVQIEKGEDELVDGLGRERNAVVDASAELLAEGLEELPELVTLHLGNVEEVDDLLQAAEDRFEVDALGERDPVVVERLGERVEREELLLVDLPEALVDGV